MTSTDATHGYVRGRVRNLQRAVQDLLSQEFSASTGHAATILNGCLFAPTLLTFWFINGILDFSTAVAIGAVATPAGLQVRLVAYLLLVPTFLLGRVTIHLAHPVHRRQVLSGACPNTQYLSLDWFSMGILATGLPLAFQNLGPLLLANVVFVLGLFVLPRFVRPDRAPLVKGGALAVGTLGFLYVTYGGSLPLLPDPPLVFGPFATVALSDATITHLLRTVNSVLVGPFVVAGIGLLFNYVLTRPELTDIPLLHHSLPARDPASLVVLNTALGTWFYLSVVALATGSVVLVP